MGPTDLPYGSWHFCWPYLQVACGGTTRRVLSPRWRPRPSLLAGW